MKSPEQANPLRQRVDWWWAGSGWPRMWSDANNWEVSFGGWWKCSKIRRWWQGRSLLNEWKATELCISKGWIVWYVISVSIKLWFGKKAWENKEKRLMLLPTPSGFPRQCWACGLPREAWRPGTWGCGPSSSSWCALPGEGPPDLPGPSLPCLLCIHLHSSHSFILAFLGWRWVDPDRKVFPHMLPRPLGYDWRDHRGTNPGAFWKAEGPIPSKAPTRACG